MRPCCSTGCPCPNAECAAIAADLAAVAVEGRWVEQPSPGHEPDNPTECLLNEARRPESPGCTITVFCGANLGRDRRFIETAQEVGRACGEAGVRLIYGGAPFGLMGEVARAAAAAGSEVRGIVPGSVRESDAIRSQVEGINSIDVGVIESVEDLHERKDRMALAHAFVILPGGYGTLDELFEMVTWMQLGVQAPKPVAIVNTGGYFDGLRTFVQRAKQDGFVSEGDANLMFFADSVASALAYIRSHVGECWPRAGGGEP
jgi:uncharacterized protein (TIGR00730 family)